MMKRKFNFIIIFIIIGFCFNIKSVNASEVKTLLNIENPISNKIYKNELSIDGWIMSNSKASTIKIYFNDTEITNVNRHSRNDVINAIKGYGDKEINPNPGFTTTVDLSKYKDGTYNVRVDVLENEKVINSSNKSIKVLKANSMMYIEQFSSTVIGTKTEFSGWYMSDLKGTILKILIDNDEITNINRYYRNDVINAIKNYGTIETTPMPGFGKIIDLTKYNNGIHTISVQLINPNTQEIILNKSNKFLLTKSKTKLNIETPSIDQIAGLKLKISGWMMSTNIDDEIRILFDNDEISLKRESRNDVIKAVKGYGDSTTNKAPGFVANVDLSNYEDGKHNIKVQVINKITKEVISEEEKSITLNKYKSKMVLEEPSVNSLNSPQVTIGGWLMSSNPNQTIKLYLDDKEFAILNRTPRNDVINAIKGYGDREINPTPGFYQTIDLSRVKDGQHILKVEAIDSNTGKKLVSQSKTINLKKYKTLLNVETQNNIKTNVKFNVNGWVMSTNPNTSIRVTIDEKEYNDFQRTSRPDVIKAIKEYGDAVINPTPGFNQILDLAEFKDGVHLLKVEVVDNLTSEVLASRTQKFNVNKYKGLIAIENPESDKTIHGTVHQISGWVMSNSPTTYLKIYIDNSEIKNLNIDRKSRNDVLRAITGYGDNTTNPTPGYSASIDLSKYKDGIHKITVILFNSITNEKISSESKNIKLKKYYGKLFIESPSRSTFNSKFVLSGWEMSESPDSKIEFYIDNGKFNIDFDRTSRNDVINAIKGYGDATVNSTPGFSGVIDLSNISDGSHTMTVKLVSNSGDVLTTFSKKIFVYRNVYFGIDVSYYQGNINFKTLKNEGIDFSIIRMGYRGYGTGAVQQDIRSKEYIEDAIKNNINIGLYFFSQAINEQEAIEEANFMIKNIDLLGIGSKIKYPIVFDTEYSTPAKNGRADGLSKQQRTNVAKAFLNRIKQSGYTPMIYASKSFLYDNLDMSQLQDYDVWVAHYNGTKDPINDVTDYTGVYQMWQYTSTGSVNGIIGDVDLDISYKKY